MFAHLWKRAKFIHELLQPGNKTFVKRPSRLVLALESLEERILLAAPVISLSDAGGVFNGSAFSATATVAGVNPGVDDTPGPSLEGVALVVTYFAGSTATGLPLTSDPVNAGTYTVDAYFPGSTSYSDADAQVTFVIDRASPVLSVANAGGTFNGSTFAATGTVAGVVAGVDDTPGATLDGESLTLTYYSGNTTSGPALAGPPSAAGHYTVDVSYPGTTDNYTSADVVAGLTIDPATPVVSIADAGGTFNGSSFAATASVAGVLTGVDDTPSPALEGSGLVVSYFTWTGTAGSPLSGAPSAAGTYLAVAAFPGSADYAGTSSQVVFTIEQGTPTLGLSDAGGIYNGSAFPANATIHGVVAGVDDAPAPYLESVSVVVTYYPGSDTSSSPLSGAPVYPGTYTADAYFPGSGDYVSSEAQVTFTISKAAPLITLSDAGGTFNNWPFAATAVIAGVVAGVDDTPGSSLEGTDLVVSYYAGSYPSGTALAGAPTTAGSYYVVGAFAGSANYVNSQSVVSFTTAKADPVIALTDTGGTFSASPFTATATVAGVVTGVDDTPGPELEGHDLAVTYYRGSTATGTPLSGAPTAGGTYTAKASFPGSTDYSSASTEVAFTITYAQIEFSSPAMSVNENAGTVQATVNLDQELAAIGEFYVNVVGGTALQGIDYTPDRGHKILSVGATSLAVNVAAVINNSVYEPDKTIILDLVPVDKVSLGSVHTLTITIHNTNSPPDTSGPAGPAVLTPDRVAQDQEQARGAFYDVALASGTLTATHALPAFKGTEAVQLVYNSETAAPKPIFLVRHPLSGTTVATTVSATLTLDGVAGSAVYYDTSAMNPGDTIQMALQADATGLPTGRYPYEIDVTENLGTPVVTTYSGSIDVINNAAGPFGAGWSIAGLARLWPLSGGALLEQAGGTTLWFAAGSTAGTFTTPAGDFSTLVQNTDGSFTRTLHDGTRIDFDSAGRQTTIAERNGNTTTYAYSTDGVLLSITDPFGSATTFAYSGGKVAEITDPAGRTTSLAYDGGLLAGITDPDPDGAGPLAAPVISLAYDTAGHLTDWTDPLAHTTTFVYNFAGRVSTVLRPDASAEHVLPAQLVGLARPGFGTSTNPAPAVLAGQMFANTTDPNNGAWNTRLDDLGFGLATEKVDPLGDTSFIVRNTDGLPTELIDPLGRITQDAYDTHGDVLQQTMADGAVYSYAYNAFGEVTQLTEPVPDVAGTRAAPVTQYVYDSAGNLTRKILPDDDTDPTNNPTWIFTYGSYGLLSTSTDPNGNMTSYAYNALGEETQITYPDANPALHPQVSMTYDGAGNLSARTNERGFTTSYLYDNLNRLIQITYPDNDTNPANNPKVTRAYNAAGGLVAQTDPLGNTTTYAFDSMNRLATVTGPDPDGSGPQAAAVTSYGYDPAGNLTSVTDPIGQITTSSYDAANQLVTTSQGANTVTSYGYDAAGEQVSVSSPAPDHTYPGSRLSSFSTYGPRGNLLTRSNNYGNLQTFQYNNAGERIGFT